LSTAARAGIAARARIAAEGVVAMTAGALSMVLGTTRTT
jgi:hypothetical protein